MEVILRQVGSASSPWTLAHPLLTSIGHGWPLSHPRHLLTLPWTCSSPGPPGHLPPHSLLDHLHYPTAIWVSPPVPQPVPSPAQTPAWIWGLPVSGWLQQHLFQVVKCSVLFLSVVQVSCLSRDLSSLVKSKKYVVLQFVQQYK